MEFNEKLQELRKQKELTQEELAEVLFVSRSAISKWEAG
ncbi:MAG: helix-turn-helix transcriptional regulator, partial [Clostridia bacterium]|nr:helix-turn-helix transcriptional regulator [Clostridia bacterium]